MSKLISQNTEWLGKVERDTQQQNCRKMVTTGSKSITMAESSPASTVPVLRSHRANFLVFHALFVLSSLSTESKLLLYHGAYLLQMLPTYKQSDLPLGQGFKWYEIVCTSVSPGTTVDFYNGVVTQWSSNVSFWNVEADGQHASSDINYSYAFVISLTHKKHTSADFLKTENCTVHDIVTRSR